MNATELLSSEHYKYLPKNNGNGRLLLAFTNRTPRGQFSWLPTYARSNCNVLAINCHRVTSVSESLDGLLNMIGNLEDELRTIIAHLSPTYLFSIGHSLAAFPAIIVGAKFGAQRTVAMSPETLIGMPFSRSHKRLKGRATTYEVPDLVPFIQQHPVQDLRVIAGELDVVDLYAASRLAGLPNVWVYSLPGSAHGTISTLIKQGSLRQIITKMDDPEFPLASAKEFFGGSAERWFQAVGKLRRQPTLAEGELREVALRHPQNASVFRHLAQSLRSQKKYDESLQHIKRAAELSPERPEIQKILAEIEAINSTK